MVPTIEITISFYTETDLEKTRNIREDILRHIDKVLDDYNRNKQTVVGSILTQE